MDKTVAILGRTNAVLRPAEQALADAGIKYRNLGKSGYFSQPEIKGVLSYLGCVLYPADWLIAGALHSSLPPAKFLPKTKLLAALKEQHKSEADPKTQGYFNYVVRIPELLVDSKNLPALRDFVSFIHSLSRYKSLPADEALKSVIQALKAVEYYREESSIDNDPVANLSQLVQLAQRHNSLKEFLDYCRRASAASKSKAGVIVGTCHAAKGLEFHTVYLIGCQEGLFPHAKSDDLEGERNCFFVGCSRAEHRLVITYSGTPSPFLNQKGGIINPSTTESK